MNGKRDHVSSVAARARVSDKSGLFHCISAHQGYKRDFRISKRPDAGPRPSQIIKNEISLATYSDLDAKVSFGTLVEPLWLTLGAPRFPQDLPKSVPRQVPERPKSSKMRSQRRLGATLAPRPLLASSLEPLWHPLGGTRRPQDPAKAPKIEPKGSLNDSQTRQNHC